MILTALNNYYDRLVDQGVDNVPPYGFSQEKISYALIVNREGDLIDLYNLMITSGNDPEPRIESVPKFEQKTSGIKPYFLWDKTSYVLGVSRSAKKRVADEHREFVAFHQELLRDLRDDDELGALCKFLHKWNPETFGKYDFLTDEMLDSNVIFKLENKNSFIHENKEAKKAWRQYLEFINPRQGTCLITGESSSIARIHPSIKGVKDAQSSGASIVSFNDDAYLSYGGSINKLRSKGQNDTGASCPVSLDATIGYTTALNYLLRRDENNKHRLQIGDSTVVFWAEAATNEGATAAEDIFSILLQPPAPDDKEESNKLHSTLLAVSKGRPLETLDPKLQADTRIYVLGLAPNASRLSIRFWQVDTLDMFAKRVADHYQDLLLEPQPWKAQPAIWRLLAETVPHRENSKPKLDDVAPQLAGEMARAIFTGSRYPRSLLSNLIMRMRADGDISPLRVALCKAVLVREARLSNRQNHDKEIPVSLDTENTDPGYLLGRLFSSLESIQRGALGGNVNATIRDRYFGAASATPASVFPVLMRNAQNHLSKIKKNKPGLATNLEKQLDEIVDKLEPQLPKSLRIESQGRFAIGYYHQRAEIFKKHESEIKEGEE